MKTMFENGLTHADIEDGINETIDWYIKNKQI